MIEYIFTASLVVIPVVLASVVMKLFPEEDFDSIPNEEQEDLCEHEWQFVGFDNSKSSIGILQCIYQCKKCGKIISV